MSKQCPRQWEVEAVRDGRLVEAERARVERHMARCSDCAREAHSLDQLARTLRQRPSVTPDELSVRRRRQTLLQAANVSSHVSRRVPKRWFFAIASIAAIGVLYLLRDRMRFPDEPHAPLVAVPSTDPAIEVRGDEGSVFLRASDGDIDRVVISQGRVTFAIRRHDGERRLLVQTPDAEIEDIGTEFSVLVEGGKTTEVRVVEGSVVVRFRGRAAMVVDAGFAWQPTAHAETSAKPFVDSLPPVLTASAHPNRQYSSAYPHASAAVPKMAHDDAKLPSIEPAMAAYRRGDYETAAGLFDQFEREGPKDARAEDAAYFRALALLRAGQPTAAQAAAREYLAKHPSGFRAQEVERIAKP